MNIMEKAGRLMEQYICDHCLGRQFAQLLSGHDNVHRGRLVRSLVAMSIDKEKIGSEESKMDMLNFAGFRFHFLEMDLHAIKETVLKRRCCVCNDVFKHLDKHVDKIVVAVKKSGIEFNTFLMGSKLSAELLEKEEQLWERVGIDWCEPIKAEINREIGKLIEHRMKKRFDAKNPDIVILYDFESAKIEVSSSPFFIYGEYNKLVRGMPQTKWPSGKFKTSVEQIIAKPFMVALKGKEHKLHGLGREDVDARCFGWRPFVLEILEPKKRFVKKDIVKLAKKIGKQVAVRGLRVSSIVEVRRIKEAKCDKTYRCFVQCEKAISRESLKALQKLVGEILQRTPTRVLHRRADLKRKRRLLALKIRFINSKRFLLEIKTESGFYVKEFISGDDGRTRPNISEILGPCICKDLDVVKIDRIKK